MVRGWEAVSRVTARRRTGQGCPTKFMFVLRGGGARKATRCVAFPHTCNNMRTCITPRFCVARRFSQMELLRALFQVIKKLALHDQDLCTVREEEEGMNMSCGRICEAVSWLLCMISGRKQASWITLVCRNVFTPSKQNKGYSGCLVHKHCISL